MKVLLLGDASNYHHCLSLGLSRLGHDVTVASNGSRWMDTARDIDISRVKGRLGGALLWAKLNTLLAGRLKGYDVVQINNPVFLDLRPQRVRKIFDRLVSENGAVYLTALGTDPNYVKMCNAADCPLRYSEYRIGAEYTPYAASRIDHMAQWLTDEMQAHCDYIYDHIDGAVSALYEYHLACRRVLSDDKLVYGGIPIDTHGISYNPIRPDIGCVNVMVACHKGRESEKGIDVLLPVLQRLAADNPRRMHLDLVQNVPFAQFQATLDKAHIVVDQLYSYTPASTALMAMAAGKVVVSGAEPEYYDFIGEHKLRPIINVNPTDIAGFASDMQRYIDNPGLLARLSAEGREFVKLHNDTEVVASRFVDFWERRVR